MLFHPKQEATTSIMTDASDHAVGAVLQQYVNQQWCPITYFSKKLKQSETKYSTYDRELLVIYLAMKHFHRYIEGRTFTVFIDHKPLTNSRQIYSTTDPSFGLYLTIHNEHNSHKWLLKFSCWCAISYYSKCHFCTPSHRLYRDCECTKRWCWVTTVDWL